MLRKIDFPAFSSGVHGRAITATGTTAAATTATANTAATATTATTEEAEAKTEVEVDDSFLVSYGVGDQRSEVFIASLREVMAHFS